jgi:methylenetetrahydrofolate reductase (NADPH)
MACPVSFEFFPPFEPDQQARLVGIAQSLSVLSPEYVSVTFGAGGSTRHRTKETVLDLMAQTGLAAAPHISCMADDQSDILELLTTYQQNGVKRLVVLRGDRPSGGGRGVFPFAKDLLEFIRTHFGDAFHIEVACYPEHHPESRSPKTDLLHFKDKVDAGADGAITQYFFNPDAYFRFVDDLRALGVEIPVVPGIMPITNYARLARFSNTCGAEIPLWIAKRLEAWEQAEDEASLKAFGHDVVVGLCERLIEGGAPGLHFYTLNQAKPTLSLCESLGLSHHT